MNKAKELIKKIKLYNKIIITRHKNPDMDAIGSQVGLGLILKYHFPKKEVLYLGDTNRLDFENKMDEITDEDFKDALVIVTDVAVKQMIADLRYNLAKEVIVIDHHLNDCDLEKVSLKIVDTNAEAACMIVLELFDSLKYFIPVEAASYLMYGLITDSGRFQYIKDPKRLFKVAERLAYYGADPRKLYSWLYVESLADRQQKIALEQRIVFDENIAYIKTTAEDLKNMGDEVDIFKLSRSGVGLMSGIDEIKIWANFTYNPEVKRIFCEFRSRDISIVEIARSYGGGGHAVACGAAIDSFEIADQILADFKKLLNNKE